jgi:hypothetical protein
MFMNKQIILSCSKKKTLTKGLIPAIERYDGAAFRLIRRYIRVSGNPLDIFILSGKFGLIPHTQRIPYYDSKLTLTKACKMRNKIHSQAKQLFLTDSNGKEKNYFINLGQIYQHAFVKILDDLSVQAQVISVTGSSGNRLSKMHDWLYGEKSPLRSEHQETKTKKEIFIGGIRLKADAIDIQTIVQREHKKIGTKDMHHFYSWFVEIDDIKVSVKWLVSQLTGLPVSKFHSDQARKVLQQLGLKVQRV